jgi:hypothetical protein
MLATNLKLNYQRIQRFNRDPRTPDRLIAHYLLERQLAEKLREAPAEERTRVAGEVYSRLFAELPDHPMNHAVGERPRPEHHARYLLPHLGQDVRFLEIGTGDGSLARYLARKCKSVLAIDVTDALKPAADAPKNFRFALPLALRSTQRTAASISRSAIRLWNTCVQTMRPPSCARSSDISCYFDDVATGFHLKEYTFGN